MTDIEWKEKMIEIPYLDINGMFNMNDYQKDLERYTELLELKNKSVEIQNELEKLSEKIHNAEIYLQKIEG